jgi:ADP-heptose:LPS heptosyltransferase
MATQRPRILVLCRHALGDIVLARPIFENLRAWRPDAWIIAAAYPDQVPWLVLHSEIDQTLEIPRRSVSGRKSNSWRYLIRELRKAPIELAHDMTQTERSSAFVLVSGARRRVGFAQADVKLRHRVYTDLMVWSEKDIAANHSRELYLKPLEAAGVPIVSRRVVVDVTAAEREAARARIRALIPDRDGPLILVHPGASTANKCWPAERFAAVCDQIQESGAAQLLMLCGPRERDRVDAVTGRMRTEVPVFEEVLPIRELAALLAEVDLIVGNDSGPMHLAAAVGTRVVALFGGASPVQWGPLGEGHTVLRVADPCPCPYRDLCEPPNPYHVHCVRLLRREDVLDAVMRQIAELSFAQ